MTARNIPPATAHPAIRVSEIVKQFGAFTAVDRVSFQVAQGSVFGLLGANGAGKSTLIRMLCAVLMPSGGTATVAGFDVIRNPDEVKRSIGYMSQAFSLYRDMTVSENIRLFGSLYGVFGPELRGRRDWALSVTGLEGCESTRAGNLSVGYRQRLALACATLHRPSLLFLDEPTSGVDPRARRFFWDLIDGLASEGTTVVVTTHYLEEAEYCSSLALMHAGRLIAAGSPQQVKQAASSDPLFELRCDDPAAAEGRLEHMQGVRAVTVFGGCLHVRVDPQAVESIERLASSVPGCRWRRIGATLEDAFIALTQERGA